MSWNLQNTPSQFSSKAGTLLRRDKKRRKPYALTATRAVYKEKIPLGLPEIIVLFPVGRSLGKVIWDTRRSLPIGRLEYFSF